MEKIAKKFPTRCFISFRLVPALKVIHSTQNEMLGFSYWVDCVFFSFSLGQMLSSSGISEPKDWDCCRTSNDDLEWFEAGLSKPYINISRKNRHSYLRDRDCNTKRWSCPWYSLSTIVASDKWCRVSLVTQKSAERYSRRNCNWGISNHYLFSFVVSDWLKLNAILQHFVRTQKGQLRIYALINLRIE